MPSLRLQEAIKILRDRALPDAPQVARLIFQKIGGIPAYKLVNGETATECEEVKAAITRCAAREPVQYVIGEVGFYSETYKVSPNCLIPRPDTELLVDYAVKKLPEGARFLDLCTGSGAVAISTLANTRATRAVATDISEGALEIAAENARANGVEDRITFLRHDLMHEAPTEQMEGIFAVLSNPPYVTDSEYEQLEPEIFHEPKIAFVGGEDGGCFYRRITSVYRDLIDDAGFIAYEIGAGQEELIRRIAAENRMSVEVYRDLSDKPRLAVLKKQ